MPGRKSYGPGGKWIHDRANSLMDGRKKSGLIERYGEKRGKSIAYAIATQQAHKVKKSPKKFRTSEGVRTAKMKFNKPMKEYQKTAMVAGFFDELENIEKEAIGLKGLALGAMLAAGAGGAAKAALPRAAAASGKAAITQTAKRSPDALRAGAKAFRSGKTGVGRFSGQSAEVRKAMGF